MYRDEQPGASFMLGMLTGAMVGAGIALLFAPKSGPEIRAQLGEQYRGLADRVGEQTQSLRAAAGHLRDQGRERFQQLSDRTSTDRPGSTQTTEADRFPSSAPTV